MKKMKTISFMNLVSKVDCFTISLIIRGGAVFYYC